MNKGFFIVLEGGEGSGKSTQCKLLAAALEQQGAKTLITFEPGATPLGAYLRTLLLQSPDIARDPRAELFLFLADRRQHIIDVICPALAQGMIVLCDRFSPSTLAYQGAGRELTDISEIERMDMYARDGLDPDVVFFLDVPPRVGLARKVPQSEMNTMDSENIAFHERVGGFFQEMLTAHPSIWARIDGQQSVEAMTAEMLRIIRKRREKKSL